MGSNNDKNTIIAKNTVFLYFRMILSLLVALYASRVILNNLGVVDFGIYNVVAGFVSLFGFLEATLSSSMQRYYNYEGTRSGIEGYKRVYTAGLLIHILLVIVLLVILETFGLWYVNKIMVIPANRIYAANIVFQCVIISLLLIIIRIPYVGAIIAKEKMGIYTAISLVEIGLNLLIVIIIPYMTYDKLILYSLSLSTISLLITCCYYIYTKRTVLCFKFARAIDKSIFLSILGFSGWNLLGTFAFMLKAQGLNMLLNFFFGPVVNAARGIAMQVNGGLASFSNTIVVAFRPQIVNAYAVSDNNRCFKLMFMESKVCFCLLLVFMMPIIIELDIILKIWLGDVVPEHTKTFATLALIDSLVCTLNTPMTQVAFATGKIKKYQIYSSVTNFSLIPFCIILLLCGYAASSVFAATIIFSVLNNIVCFMVLKELVSLKFRFYRVEVLQPCIYSTIIAAAFSVLICLYLTSPIHRLIVLCACIVLILFPTMFFLAFDAQERRQICQIIKMPRICQK